MSEFIHAAGSTIFPTNNVDGAEDVDEGGEGDGVENHEDEDEYEMEEDDEDDEDNENVEDDNAAAAALNEELVRRYGGGSSGNNNINSSSTNSDPSGQNGSSIGQQLSANDDQTTNDPTEAGNAETALNNALVQQYSTLPRQLLLAHGVGMTTNNNNNDNTASIPQTTQVQQMTAETTSRCVTPTIMDIHNEGVQKFRLCPALAGSYPSPDCCHNIGCKHSGTFCVELLFFYVQMTVYLTLIEVCVYVQVNVELCMTPLQTCG